MADSRDYGVTGASFGLVLLTFLTCGPIAGVASLFLYLGMCRRKKVDPVDGAFGVLGVAGDALHGVAEYTAEAPKVVEQVQKVVKGQKPILPSIQALAQQNEDEAIAVKRRNLLRSAIVLAPQKSGKTRYLLDDVQAFMGLGEGELLICDPNYGSSHDGEKPNTWYGLPVNEFVFISEDDCLRVIHKASQIVAQRQLERQDPANVAAGKTAADLGHTPILLLVDEESMVASRFALDDFKEQKVEFQSDIRNLLQRGHKQNVFIKLVCHDYTTATTQLPQTFFAQADLIVLGAAAVGDRYLKACEIDKGFAGKVLELRQYNPYAYLTKISGEVSVCPMPFIPEPDFEYTIESEDSDPWKEEWLTDERVGALEALPDDARIKQDVAMGVFELSASRCRKTNKDYVKIQEIWAEILEVRKS